MLALGGVNSPGINSSKNNLTPRPDTTIVRARVKSAMFTPTNTFQNVSFFALAGVETARLEDSGVIVGKFATDLRAVRASRNKFLCEEFVNWGFTDQDILRFTKTYGPLEAAPDPGSQFEVSVSNWRMWQGGLRFAWEGGTSIQGFATDRPQWRGWQQGEEGLVYRAANLMEYMNLSFWACPKERRRKCIRPDCPHPYFIARHLKQNYCSEICAKWAQARWKREWWSQHGKTWRDKTNRRKHGGRS